MQSNNLNLIEIINSAVINLSNKMANEMSYAMKMSLKKVPKVTSEYSAHEILQWLSIVKTLNKDLAITDHDNFF